MTRTLLLAALTCTLLSAGSGQVLDRQLRAHNLSNTKVGSDPIRRMAIYLPADYERSARRYPVIYFLPNPFGSYRAAFDQEHAQTLIERALDAHAIEPFILVSIDMNTPLGCSWYVNSPATGNWEDFVIQELVPYIDREFRTIARRDSRGIAGDFMGGYGAIRFGMRYPDVFAAVYALHPVGTGSGVQTMFARPNWDLLSKAQSPADLKQDGLSIIFTTIFQAHIPNPNRPPLYIDLQASKDGDHMRIDSAVTEKLRRNFLLESQVGDYADNLKSLRGFKFDWARNDGNYDHVYANQALTHKLDEFGIPHEAEEYNGLWGHGVWGEDGRFYNNVLPFFARHLAFK
jgi:enterochelin esterase-like enzyme